MIHQLPRACPPRASCVAHSSKLQSPSTLCPFTFSALLALSCSRPNAHDDDAGHVATSFPAPVAYENTERRALAFGPVLGNASAHGEIYYMCKLATMLKS